jgi:hypothetical protein
MADYTTYSFLDLSGAIVHPDLGAYIFTGQGTGQVTITMQTEKTQHNVAADGVVMVSKMAGHNGQVQIQCQQTSAVHKWLLAAYNAVYVADTDAWADMSATLRNASDGTSHILTGLSFGKMPDKTYQAEGQMISWTLWAANVVSLPA